MVAGGSRIARFSVDQFLDNLRFPRGFQSVRSACHGFVTKLSTCFVGNWLQDYNRLHLMRLFRG